MGPYLLYQDGSDRGIFGQDFDALGTPSGGEFQINSHTSGSQGQSSIDHAPDGSFVVVWRSPQDGSNMGIVGQRFLPPIFGDGFESGDTSAWSSTAP